MKKSDFQEAVRILTAGESFLLLGHVSPDGDCLGSILSMTLALVGMGKKAFPVCLEGIPEMYRFLPGSERILHELPAVERIDVAIVLDSDRPERLGPASSALNLCKDHIIIDHHQEDQWDFGVRLVDSTSASSGEIVYQLLKEANIPLTKDIAECLLAAIVTDTGTFRFANVKPSTLRAAADMLECGTSIDKISRKVYETRTVAGTKLLGCALCNMTVIENGKIAYTFISQKDLADSGASESETDGIVNFVRSVRGVKVGIFFREVSAESTRASLRATDDVDVSEIAKSFGGGGHRAAAGCTIECPLQDAIGEVLEKVKQWMES